MSGLQQAMRECVWLQHQNIGPNHVHSIMPFLQSLRQQKHFVSNKLV